MMLLGLASLGLVSCGGGDTPIETPAEQHDSSAWFTEEELAKFARIKRFLKRTRKPIIPISPRTTLRSLGKKNSWLFPPITARRTIGLSLPR